MTIYKASSLKKLEHSAHPKDLRIFDFCKRNGVPSLSYKDYRNLYHALTANDICPYLGAAGLLGGDKFLHIALNCSREDEKVEQGGDFPLPGIKKGAVDAYNSASRKENGCSSFSEFARARIESGIRFSEIIRQLAGAVQPAGVWDSICKASYIIDTLADLHKDRAKGIVSRIRIRDFAFLLSNLAHCITDAIRDLGFFQAVRHLLPSTLLVIMGGLHSDSSNGLMVRLNFHGSKQEDPLALENRKALA